MRKRIFSIIGILSLMAFCACTLETQKEHVRVVYYSGTPKSDLKFPDLKLIVHAPYEISVKWLAESGPLYLTYSDANQAVTCTNGSTVHPVEGTKNIRVENLKPGTKYSMALCDSSETPFGFEFTTPSYNIMTLEQWCNYRDKSKAMESGFAFLFKNFAINSCSQILSIDSPENIIINDGEFKNKKIDLYPLSNFVNKTKKLALYDFELTDLNILNRFTQLESLILHRVALPRNNSISDLTFLRTIRQLTNLSITGFQHALLITNQLSTLVKLKQLNLSSSSIVNISADALTGLNLEYLYIEKGFFPDLSVFNKLSDLSILQIRDSKLNSLSGIEGLLNLRSLDVSKNELKNIDELKAHNLLDTLVLADNPIDNVDVLLLLENLSKVDLRFTQLESVSSLKPLEQGPLERFYFRGTTAFETESCPFSRIEICRDFVNE